MKKSTKPLLLHKWFKSLFWAIVVLVVFRIFFFQSYTVINDKMDGSVLPGDYLIVNKMTYGPRLPITFFSFPINETFIPLLHVKSYINLFELPYLRLKTNHINRNDILIYNYPNLFDVPADLKPVEISRCIALPGDTLVIKNKKVFINNNKLNDSLPLKFRYRITTNGTLFRQSFIDSLNIKGKLIADMGVYEFFLTRKQVQIFNQLNFVKYIQDLFDFNAYNSIFCFPVNSKNIAWNKDYFGPVIIPKKGETVSLSINNIDIYKKIISNYENNELLIDEDENMIYINKKRVTNYQFKQNYFFVMDDNRDMAKDSRYWGFLPESHIIGVANRIWFSVEKNANHSNIRWNRLFKSTNQQ